MAWLDHWIAFKLNGNGTNTGTRLVQVQPAGNLAHEMERPQV